MEADKRQYGLSQPVYQMSAYGKNTKRDALSLTRYAATPAQSSNRALFVLYGLNVMGPAVGLSKRQLSEPPSMPIITKEALVPVVS